MWFLTLITYVSFFVQLCFVTVAIAAGLYYLAELVEEYTIFTKKCIWWMNAVILLIYICLGLFEDFPISVIIFGVVSNMANFLILKDFPYVMLFSPGFLAAVTFVIINHYLAFQFFAEVYHSFAEVMAYFTLCLWLVPFALFISLSANDNVLPTTVERIEGDVVSNYFSKKGKKYGLLTMFNYAKESILPQRTKKGF